MVTQKKTIIILLVLLAVSTWHSRTRSRAPDKFLENFSSAVGGSYNLSIVTISSASEKELLFFENQAHTCTAFFNLNEIDTWWLVVPEHRVDSVRTFLERICSERSWCAPWEVLSEETVSPTVPVMRVLEAERRQRYLKLAVSRFIRTDFYLIFDSDILCTRKTSVSDLFIDGRAKATLYGGDAEVFWGVWVPASEAALEIPLPQPRKCLDVTPQIFHKDTLRALELHLWYHSYRRLEDLHRSLHRWMEYSIYYLVATKYGTWEKRHIVVPNNEFLQRSVWDRGAVDRWNTDEVFSPDGPGYFVVFQTNTKVSGAVVREKISRYIPTVPAFPFIMRPESESTDRRSRTPRKISL